MRRNAGNIRQRRQTVADGDPLGDSLVNRLDGSYTATLGVGAAARGAMRWGNGARSATYTRYLDGPISPPVGGSKLLDSPNRALPATNGPVEAANRVLELLARLPTSARG